MDHSFKHRYSSFNDYAINTWLPYYPAALFEPLKDYRRRKYMSRWIENHNFNNGYVIVSKKIDKRKNVLNDLLHSLFDSGFINKNKLSNTYFNAYYFEKNNDINNKN